MKVHIINVLVFLCLIANPDVRAADTTPQAYPAKIFQSTLLQIKSKTKIPILLPSEFPVQIIENDIHFSVGSGNPNKYEITLFYEEGAGYAAFVGYFSGEFIGKFLAKGKKVNLVNGVIGYFKGSSCGRSCSPSQISWQQDNVVYTLQLKLTIKSKAEEEQAIIKVANSAILGGAR